MILIFINTVTFMFYRPLEDPGAFPNNFIVLFQNGLTLSFLTEEGITIIARGFFFLPNSYLRSEAWNKAEFVINMFGIASMFN
jgi:hypothetical protein